MQQQVLAHPDLPNPFRLSIGPDSAFLGSEWRQARDEALVAAFGPPGLTFVTGEPGTGKSLLLLAVAESLKKRNRPALHVRRGEVPPAERERAILLVDEGDRLDETARERIVARASSFPCVVAGSPTLPVQFGEAVRGATIIALAPMSAEEVGLFLADRLAQAGLPPLLFSEDAVAALAGYSHGIPRVVAMLASSAWLLSGASPDTRITSDHIVEAMTIRDGFPPDVPVPRETVVIPTSPLPPPTSESPSEAQPPETVSVARGAASAAPAEIAIARAVSVDVSGPVGIPPYKRVSSLAPRRFDVATAIVAVTVMALAIFIDRGAIDDLLTSNGNRAADQTASIAPLAPAPVQAQPTAPGEPQRPAEPPAPAPIAANEAATPVQSVAVTQAPPAPARPATHVVVRFHRGDAAAGRRAAAVVDKLRQIGLQVDAPTPVATRITRPKLQYFFEEDRGAATAVASYLGSRFGQEVLSKPGPGDQSAEPGTVEIRIPGTPPPRRPPPEEDEDASG